MAVATTQEFEELVLEVASTVGSPVSWSKLCGLVDVTITRTSNLDTAEVPDCADESLPLSLEKSVRSIEISISATGVWASESWEIFADWFYNSERKLIRIGNLGAASGDTQYETGFAYLSNLTNARTKGQKVSAQIEIMFDGTPTRS